MELAKILDKAKRTRSASDSSDSSSAQASSKTKKKKKNKEKKANEEKKKTTVKENPNQKKEELSPIVSVEEVRSLGARPKRPPRSIDNPSNTKADVKPLMDVFIRGREPPDLFKAGQPSLLQQSPRKTKADYASGDKPFVEKVMLRMDHEYLEYQFMSHYLDELLDKGSCDTEVSGRTIRIRSSSQEEANAKKITVLDMLRNLNKDTREVQRGVKEASFETAAKDLRLRFLLNSSVQILNYDVGGVSVIVCKPTIQCIKADGIIIAVKDDLYMNQSGIGSILATADPGASKALRSRYNSQMVGTLGPGTCQEISSQDSSVLWDYYLVIVVDPEDKGSLERGFSDALRRCQSLGLSSVVTNLLGSDFKKGFVNDKESASAILRSLSEYVRTHEKTRLHTLYLCETDDYKIGQLKCEIIKHGKGVKFVDTALPDVGSPMISICSHTKQEGDEFFRRCAPYLV